MPPSFCVCYQFDCLFLSVIYPPRSTVSFFFGPTLPRSLRFAYRTLKKSLNAFLLINFSAWHGPQQTRTFSDWPWTDGQNCTSGIRTQSQSTQARVSIIRETRRQLAPGRYGWRWWRAAVGSGVKFDLSKKIEGIDYSLKLCVTAVDTQISNLRVIEWPRTSQHKKQKYAAVLTEAMLVWSVVKNSRPLPCPGFFFHSKIFIRSFLLVGYRMSRYWSERAGQLMPFNHFKK